MSWKRHDPRSFWQLIVARPSSLAKRPDARRRSDLPCGCSRYFMPEPSLIVRKLVVSHLANSFLREVIPQIRVSSWLNHEHRVVVRTRIDRISTFENDYRIVAIEQFVQRTRDHQIQVQIHDRTVDLLSLLPVRIEQSQSSEAARSLRPAHIFDRAPLDFSPHLYGSPRLCHQQEAKRLLQIAKHSFEQSVDVDVSVLSSSPQPSADSQLRQERIPIPLWRSSCRISRKSASSQNFVFNSCHTS